MMACKFTTKMPLVELALMIPLFVLCRTCWVYWLGIGDIRSEVFESCISGVEG